MPIGIIVNSLSVAVGAILGALVGHRLSDGFKENLNMIFAVCSMAMGVSGLQQMENMPAVIFSAIIGTALGLAIHLGDRIAKAGEGMQHLVSRLLPIKKSGMPEAEFNTTLITIIVLFCASSTGIYGSIVSGMTGEHTILFSKSILDFFTAMIFACLLGPIVAFIALPQFCLFFALFLLAGVIYPLTTPSMINDFKACGGILMIATGFRMLKLRMFPTADMIPGMLLAMPCSWFWQAVITPLL